MANPPPIPNRFQQLILLAKGQVQKFTRRTFVKLHLASLPRALAWGILASIFLGFIIFISSVRANFTRSQQIQPDLIAPTGEIATLAVSTETPIKLPAATLTPSFTATFTQVPTETLIPTITFTPTEVFTPTVMLPAVDLAACVNPNAERQVGTVTRIVDGDTIHVVIDGTEYKLRYIGMNAPEVGQPNADAATNYNSQLVMGKQVTLVKDVSETDRYDRLLRYVFVGDTFVNYELVAKGLAKAGTWEPDTACDSEFFAAQNQARLSELGLWKPAAIVAPTVPVVPLPTSTSPAMNSNCDPSYPTICIPPPPPDLDCKDITFRRFKVLPPDPHNFDGDHDGIGC